MENTESISKYGVFPLGDYDFKETIVSKKNILM